MKTANERSYAVLRRWPSRKIPMLQTSWWRALPNLRSVHEPRCPEDLGFMVNQSEKCH